MKDFFILLLAIALGSFIALIAWTLIVKSQVSAQLSTTSSVGGLLSLFSARPKPAGS